MPDAPPGNSAKPLVLIGGADAGYLGFLEYVLKIEGFDVLRGDSGAKVLEAVTDLKAGVVVLDGTLAESLTVDAWRRLHSGIAARRKAVIVLTDRDSQRIAAVGANGSVVRYIYVSKSSRPPEIIASIREVLAGEGVQSLARAFMYAGARTVVASLWQVSDWAAADTFESFYRAVLGEDRSPADALREAKLAIRRGETHRGVQVAGSGDTPAMARQTGHPYFWAPFVCIGSDRR